MLPDRSDIPLILERLLAGIRGRDVRSIETVLDFFDVTATEAAIKMEVKYIRLWLVRVAEGENFGAIEPWTIIENSAMRLKHVIGHLNP